MTSRDEILVLDPAVQLPELDAFNHMSGLSALPMSYHLPALLGMESVLAEQQRCRVRGLIILGSASSVNDGLPWQAPFFNWVEQQVQAGVPTLGICFGHQLIAHLAGSRIELIGTPKLVGLRSVSVAAEPRLGLSTPSEVSLVVSHQEQVVGVPDGMTLLAQSSVIPIEALAHRSLPVWSFQAHLEATPPFCQARHIKTPDYAVLREGHRLLQRFINFCCAHSK